MISEKVKQDAAARRVGMLSKIDRNLREIAGHEASIAALITDNARLAELETAYENSIPAPKEVDIGSV